MTRTGLFPGLRGQRSYDFVPQLRCMQLPGDPAPVDPNLGSDATLNGSYFQTPEGLVIYEFELIAGTSPTPGTGSAYLLRLPIPALRWTKSAALPNGADLPIGSARIDTGSSSDPCFSRELLPTLADPGFPFYWAQSDQWVQFFHSGPLDAGTDTIAASGTSKTVTTNRLVDRVKEHDIDIHPIGTASGSNWQYMCATNITIGVAGTSFMTFDVTTKASVGTGGQSFAWRVDGIPWTDSGNNSSIVPMLLSPCLPFYMQAGWRLTGQLFYEGRRR